MPSHHQHHHDDDNHNNKLKERVAEATLTSSAASLHHHHNHQCQKGRRRVESRLQDFKQSADFKNKTSLPCNVTRKDFMMVKAPERSGALHYFIYDNKTSSM